jgi:hypothetical protein
MPPLLADAVGFDKLSYIGLRHFIRHTGVAVRIECLFTPKETVSACQVAGRSCWLGQHMDT